MSARILVAEDDPEIRFIVVECLQEAGHVVEEAADGRAALATLGLAGPHDHRIDLVVSDVRMPRATGFQVLEALRAAKRTTPVILMTAVGGADMRARAARLDALLFDKPFPLLSLREPVAWLLARRDRP